MGQKYHETVDLIKNLLEKVAVTYETFEHEPVRTSEEAAKIRTGYSIENGAKALIIKTKDKFYMLVVRGCDKFDKRLVSNLLNSKKISFATEDEVVKITNGVLPGGVPPFGSLFGLKTYVDKKVTLNEKIVFNAGDKRYSIGMQTKDYITAEKPQVENITT